jgi:hypothetical protein
MGKEGVEIVQKMTMSGRARSEAVKKEGQRGSKPKEETHLDDTPRDVSRSIRFFTSSGSCVDFVNAGSSSESAEPGVESACTVLLLSSPEYSASRKTPSSDMSSSEDVCWLKSDLYAEGIVHELSMSMSEQERSGNFFALRTILRFGYGLLAPRAPRRFFCNAEALGRSHAG